MAYADTPLFALRNWLDDAAATVTCADQQAAFPASDLREEDPSLVLRTDNVTGTKEIVLDLGQSRDVDLLALCLVNLTEAATKAVYGSADGISWGSALTGTFGGLKDTRPGGGESRNMLLFLAASTETYRYFKFSLADSANPDGFIEAARAWAAEIFQTAVAQEYGSYEIDTKSTDQVHRTPGGAQHKYAGGRAHTVSLAYEWLTENEALETFVEALDYALGQAGNLILVLEPNDSTNWWRQAFWCFVDEKGAAPHPFFGQWKKSYRFEEIVP